MPDLMWDFVLQSSVVNEVRRVIDLPTDVFVKVRLTTDMAPHLRRAMVSILLDRADPKDEAAQYLWEGDPFYYGYGRRLTVTVQRPTDVSSDEILTGHLQVSFQAASF